MVQTAPLGALLQHIAYPALAKFPRLHHRFFGDRQILAIRFHQFRPKLQQFDSAQSVLQERSRR